MHLVDIDTEEAKNAIIKLSNLMRHLLYDSEEKATSIKKEIEFINSYIELMKLRFTDKVKINVDIPSMKFLINQFHHYYLLHC